MKWTQLEHRGPWFVPPYEPLPEGVCFYYDGEDCLGGSSDCGQGPSAPGNWWPPRPAPLVAFPPGSGLTRAPGRHWPFAQEPGQAASKSAVQRLPETSGGPCSSAAWHPLRTAVLGGAGAAHPVPDEPGGVLELAQLGSATPAFLLYWHGPRGLTSRRTFWVRA